MEKFKSIMYFEQYSIEKIIEDYSDQLLVKIINKQIERENLFPISAMKLMYSMCSDYVGEIMVIVHGKDRKYGTGIVSIGEIDLFKHDWKDYTKEGQRIGRMLKKNFKEIKVSTNFR